MKRMPRSWFKEPRTRRGFCVCWVWQSKFWWASETGDGKKLNQIKWTSVDWWLHSQHGHAIRHNKVFNQIASLLRTPSGASDLWHARWLIKCVVIICRRLVFSKLIRLIVCFITKQTKKQLLRRALILQSSSKSWWMKATALAIADDVSIFVAPSLFATLSGSISPRAKPWSFKPTI